MFEVHVACHYFTLTEEEKCEDQCEIGGQCYSYNEVNPWNECQVNIANSSNNYSREAIFSNISIKGGRLLKEAITALMFVKFKRNLYERYGDILG